MSRLIDADVLLMDMGAGCIPICESGISNVTGDTLSISDYIKDAETAYDVDKVIEEMQRIIFEADIQKSYVKEVFEDLVNVVKDGGK